MTQDKWTTTNFGSINTHRGRGQPRAVPTMLARHNLHVCALQEMRGNDTEAIEKTHRLVRNGIYGLALHKKRYDVVARIFEDARFGSVYEREVAAVVVLDRWTMRLCIFTVVHPDPLGKGYNRAAPSARKRHDKQLRAQLKPLKAAKRTWHILAAGLGDFNQSVTNTARQAVTPMAWRWLKLRPAHALAVKTTGPINIDEIYFRPRGWLRVNKRTAYWADEFPELDHPVLVVESEIKKRSGWHRDVKTRWSPTD